MKIKYAIAALAATTMLSGAAIADNPRDKKKNRSAATSVSGGVAEAGPRGARAGGVTAAQSAREMERRQRRGEMSNPSAASTSTTGAVYTDRRRGSAAISTQGSATGDGSVRSSSEGEVFSSTDRQGSQADAYGVSEAEAEEPRRRPQ